MATATRNAEFRTPERIAADEALADEFERYLVSDARTGWAIHEATDERRRLAESDRTNNAIAEGGLNALFLWNGKPYRITAANRENGATTLMVEPPDANFEAVIRRRIESVPFHVLSFYQGFGFICFPEDYMKYQG